MPRLLPRLSLLAAFALAGCQPQDPLDWKIGAGSPGAYNDWIKRHHRLLPPELQHDFDRAYLFLRSDTATHLGVVDLYRIELALCPRLDGRTIRAVILASDQVEADAIRTRISLTIDNLVRNAKATETMVDPSDLQRYAAARATQEESIKVLRVRLGEIDAQVRRLSPSPP